ncbi:MAG: hypothetical protein LBE23_05885 [Vagococcus sp.]|jgi:hypothetical protein|nr:hypothetical protein [Vagococcus sp.]
MAYDSYKLIQSQHLTIKDKLIDEKKKQIEYLYNSAIDREDDSKLNNNPFNESPRIFDRKTSGGLEYITVETINSNDMFTNGDYLTFDNDNWICMNGYIFHGLYCRGNFARCTYILKFQSPDGTILSYPCISTNRLQGTGDKVTSTLILPDGRKKVTLPLDKNTILLRNDRRMYVDLHPTTPRPYVITSTDTTSYIGLIDIFVKEDLGENTGQLPDRPDLGICNYFEPTVTTTPPEGETYAELSINGSLILGGKARTVTFIFYDADGSENNTIVAMWDVILPTGYEKYFTINYVGNSCTIAVNDKNYDVIGETVIINVSDGGGGYIGKLEVVVESGW